MTLLKRVVMANLVTIFIVYLLSQHVSAFAAHSVGDFCFEMMIVLWGIAAISWRGGLFFRRATALKAIRHNRQLPFVDEQQERVTQLNYKGQTDYSSEVMLFIAGAPAALICAVMTFISLN
ncbi:hypothetical protein [Celerinatantimonas yamalensis]|uniref:DUF3899 domain-containing protein n=1 Tax=Celerinatantimonas yamalensis TaxID=559956 RepID=A0ABW9G258_9GAMM